MHKLLLLCSVAGLFLPLAVQGQVSRADAAKGKCLLWRISGHGLAAPGYLFAAMDFVCDKDYLWPATAEKYFESSKTVCLQVNVNDPDFKKKSATAFLNPGGKTLKDYFPANEYERVADYSQRVLHIDLARVQQFQPVVIRSLIVKELLGCGAPVSYMQRLADKATTGGKEMISMETVDDQVALVREIHYNEKVAKVLAEMANGSKEFEQYRKRMEDAYQQQDLAALHAGAKETSLFTEAELKTAYDKPSRKMADKIPGIMQHGQVFFALNAVHFWGNSGVIALLRQKGYSVEPVVE